jgi:hypothetical protein
MKKKKKNVARIVKNSSANYTFTNDVLIYHQTNEPVKEKSSKPHITKTTKKHLKNQNRYKTSSKAIKSMQGHSPVYE